MPYTAHYSAALTNAPNKVLVETSDTTEDATGVVRVGVTYICKSSDAEAVSGKMILDSEPPAYPNTVFRDQLQRKRLFQYQRTIEQKYGIAKIRGYYAGVLNRGQQPQIQTDTQTFSASAALTAFEIARLTGVNTFENLVERHFGVFDGRQAFVPYNGNLGNRAYAIFRFAGSTNILRRQTGALANSTESSILPPPLSAMIVNLSVSMVVASAQSASTGFNMGRLLLQTFGLPAVSQSPEKDILQSKTPLEWLSLFPSAYSITGRLQTEYITPSVLVVSGESLLAGQTTSETLVSQPPPAQNNLT